MISTANQQQSAETFRLHLQTGTIIRIVLDKGFGFIRCSGHRENVFFHASELSGGLEFNEQLVERYVAFSVQSDSQGLKAVGIVPAE